MLHLRHSFLSSYQSYGVGVTLMVKKLRLKMTEKLDQDPLVSIARLRNHARWGHTSSLPLPRQPLTSRRVPVASTDNAVPQVPLTR